MKLHIQVVLQIVVLCLATRFCVNALSSSEEADTAYLEETCCTHGEAFAVTSSSVKQCSGAEPPDDIEPEQLDICRGALERCCKEHFKKKDECSAGLKFAAVKRCTIAKGEIGKTCCEECQIGILTGETQGKEACVPGDDVSPNTGLRKSAYYQCCLKAATKPETTTKKPTTTTVKTTTSTTTTAKPKEKCKQDSCEHLCNDDRGIITCACNEGFRLQPDKRSCKDINECAEAIDDLCTVEGTVCHNTPGAFKCVPIRKRDVGPSCPPGFKRNAKQQVCDDINECQLPTPPCPKYLCQNTIGAYKCAGKLGKPFDESAFAVEPTVPSIGVSPSSAKSDIICPSGFRAGPDDECVDIDECTELLDDCQRLSQYCINTHGSYFCQDHVSKRCSPGFKVNKRTGICEDIDECQEDSDVCKRNEVCVNLPGEYRCQSKISTLPKLSKTECQTGTRLKPGGNICEDIDECTEGTHLCDAFQNCINTYGGHECWCKNGFELNSAGSCEDIDECALKMDNCGPGMVCVNNQGSFTCQTRPRNTSSTAAPAEYEYYYSDEDNSTATNELDTDPIPPTRSEPRPVPRPTPSPYGPPATSPRIARPTTPKPSPTTPKVTTLKSTTPKLTTPKPTTQKHTAPKPTTPKLTTSTSTTPRPTTLRPTTPRPTTTKFSRPTYPSLPSELPTTPPTPPTYETPPPPPSLPPKPEPEPQPNHNRPESYPRPSTRRPYRTRPVLRRPEYPYSPRRPRPESPTEPNEVPIPARPYNPRRPTEDSSPESPYTPRRPETTRPDSPYYPSRPADPNPLEIPYSPDDARRPDTSYYPRRPDRPVEVTVPPPKDPLTIEKEKDADGTYNVNTAEIPKDRWTNVVGKDKPETPDDDFDANLHCLNGFVKNAQGDCVDIDECAENTHLCTKLEDCVNREGGYFCNCKSGTRRDSTGRCVEEAPVRTTTERAVLTTPPPRAVPRPYVPPVCDVGYEFSLREKTCVDTDECSTNRASCSPTEECVNTPGGYRCVCGSGCRLEPITPSYVIPPRPHTNQITVGSQYGKRGERLLQPSYTRQYNGAAVIARCPFGYKLTDYKMCLDIDECAKNVSECGPQQRCENFYGGYSCSCPEGHMIGGTSDCVDINECDYGQPCPYNAKCVNTVGSYRCECSEGFRNALTNDKMCVDIDECSESPQICEQGCANAWGGYRCYCNKGYRLNSDNRTCADVDECAEWGSVRTRGRLCAGDCVNTPGSFRCRCPPGYRAANDGRSCIDIDECEDGTATCARGAPGEVCQNTQGGYHCHKIRCPDGYRLESKHRCTRIQRSCAIGDWSCLHQPSSYSYNFITFVANIYLPKGRVDLFTMHGPLWSDSVVEFELRMLDVQPGFGVKPADRNCFDMVPMGSVCRIALVCSLEGPQVVEMELTMSLYTRGQFAGSAAARLIVIVSQYEF